MDLDDERSSTPKGRRQRDRIVRSAEARFASDGFHGASMRDLAAAAGLPLATTVYHFARKQQLYGAVLDAIARDLTGSLEAAIAHQREPTAQLDAFARALVEWALANPRRVVLLLRELLDNPARVRRARRLPLAPILTRVAELVAAAHPFARGLSAQLMALHAFGGISYLVAAAPTFERIAGDARALSRHKREAIALTRRALGLPHGAPS
jgi:AcrR family transcriptional regulator